jgi:hypothetical protein
MARAHPNITVLNGAEVVPSAQVQVNVRATGLPAVIFQSESGGTVRPGGNPFTCDGAGRAPADVWLNRGAYNLICSGPDLDPFPIPWESVPGADGGIDSDWLGAGAVAASKIAAGAVTPDKISDLWITHTWGLLGEIRTAQGAQDYITPFPIELGPNQTARLKRVRARRNSGTSFTYRILRNSTNVTGTLTCNSANPTPVSLDVPVVDGDQMFLEILSVTGAPSNGSVTLAIATN